MCHSPVLLGSFQFTVHVLDPSGTLPPFFSTLDLLVGPHFPPESLVGVSGMTGSLGSLPHLPFWPPPLTGDENTVLTWTETRKKTSLEKKVHEFPMGLGFSILRRDLPPCPFRNPISYCSQSSVIHPYPVDGPRSGTDPYPVPSPYVLGPGVGPPTEFTCLLQ